ncbi:AAA family ATPase [Micromonospora tulbaghiae]|uniref:AAA family ATPase n=1 Tax=Micromonospora tulbaghiae TaxID=479978 RepID=UPI0033D04E0F
MAYKLTTRQPTGRIPWPLVLVEGPEKAGKSYAAALLSASPKVGRTFWIDLAEGSADEYGAIKGARYEIVEHDGTWGSIFGAVEAIHAVASQAAASNEPPVVLVIDSMTAEWDMLKDWAGNRAKGSATNRRKLAQDPNAELTISTNYWNDANSRHRKLMRLLMTFPGIAVMTARGKWVAAMGDNGQPVEGKKEYKVEGQKSLAFDASCWVRLDRDNPGQVIGCRSVHTGIRPGHDDPKPLPSDWTLEWLIFDALKCDPREAHVRDVVELQPGDEAPESPRFAALMEAIANVPTVEALKVQWQQIQPALNEQEISEDEARRASAAVTERKAALTAAAESAAGAEPAGASA